MTCMYVCVFVVVGEQRLELEPHALDDPLVSELITVSAPYSFQFQAKVCSLI